MDQHQRAIHVAPVQRILLLLADPTTYGIVDVMVL